MSFRFVFLTTTLALASVPTLAAAQTTAARPAPAAQANPTRAMVQAQLQANFKAIDTNGDGTLSQAELATAEARGLQQRIAAMRAQVEAQFTKSDTNRDGQLSKVEFMTLAPAAPATQPNGALVLGALDKSKDGKVTLDEYRAPILAQFDKADTNRDGTISPAERQAAQPRQ